jgi:hypothetical protein
MVCAGVGARSQVGVLRWPLPVAHVDGTAGYSAASALTGAEELLTHTIKVRHCRGKRSLKKLRRLIEQCTLERLLCDPELWRRLRFVVRVKARGEVFTCRVEAYEGEPAQTITGPVWGELWVTGYDLALVYATIGRVPELIEAYVWETGQPLSGLQPVEVLDGWTYDPTGTLRGERVFHDYGLLVAAYRAHLKHSDDTSLDPLARRRRRDAVKPNGNALVYGKAVQYSIDAGGKPRVYIVETWQGAVSFFGRAEYPGEWCYPPQGAFIVSTGRLLLGLLLHLVELAGGSWTQCDTDGATIHVTILGGLEPCPGGPYRDDQGRECVRCLSWVEFDKIRRRFHILADAVGLPTPKEVVVMIDGETRILTDHPDAERSLFKIEELNRDPDEPSRIVPSLVAIAFGQKRYGVSRLAPDGTLAYDPRGTYSAHGLGHAVNLSGLTERRFYYECHRVLHAWTCEIEIIEPTWLDTPLLTQLTVRRPDDYKRYRKLIPDLCAGDVLLVAHRWAGGPEVITRHPVKLSEWGWASAGWIDTATGNHVHIRLVCGLSGLLGQPSLDPEDHQAVAVESLRGQLQRISQGTERLTATPTGEACTTKTRGIITPLPVKIVARQTTGKESHRLAERQAGLKPDGSETQVFAHDPHRVEHALRALDGLSQAGLQSLGLRPELLSRARAGEPLTRGQQDKLASAAAAHHRGHVAGGSEAPIDVALAALPVTPPGDVRVCLKAECSEAVSGRRVWCPTHAQASSIDKRRWRRSP